jgi:hypothetical protein
MTARPSRNVTAAVARAGDAPGSGSSGTEILLRSGNAVPCISNVNPWEGAMAASRQASAARETTLLFMKRSRDHPVRS